MGYWANGRPTVGSKGGSGLGAGVFFFDTVDGTNPQQCNCAASANPELTPAESWSSSVLNGDFLMTGFVYVNAKQWGTTGGGNASNTLQANFPGEPFRDIGSPRYDFVANAWAMCGGQVCRDGAGDGVFTCPDLNGNGRCDIVTMPAPAWYSYDPAITGHAAGTTYVVKTWKSPAEATADYGAPCTLPAAIYDGTNAAPTDCSEPHEPYLNIIFPATDCTKGTACLKVGWEASAGSHSPKLIDANRANAPRTPTMPMGGSSR
jgi:hypothetical protein